MTADSQYTELAGSRDQAPMTIFSQFATVAKSNLISKIWSWVRIQGSPDFFFDKQANSINIVYSIPPAPLHECVIREVFCLNTGVSHSGGQLEYLKQPLTLEEQADKLIARGLLAERDELVMRLSVVSYYRLSTYLYPFRQP